MKCSYHALVEGHLTAAKVVIRAGIGRGVFQLVVALVVIGRVDSQRTIGLPGVGYW